MLLCALLIMSSVAFAQTGSISGKILDETDQPMPSATVAVQGTQKSTATDVNGNFKLTGLANGKITLEVRFLGYMTATRIVDLNGTATVNVSLKPNSSTLNEVVVIGYGTQKKATVTGAISSVSADDLKGQQVTRVDDALQ